MICDRSLVRPYALAAVFAVVVACSAHAQEPVKRDVPYVPTPREVVARMLELADVKKDEYVIDLGSGDGRIAIAAAKDHGARALGVDIDPQRIKEANANAAEAGVTDRVAFRRENLFETPFKEADVITMYLLTSVNMKLRPRLLEELRPGTRVVSHAFAMGDWKADVHETVEGRDVYLWIIPAKVEGQWAVKDGERSFTLDLEQEFQRVSGSARLDGTAVPVLNGKLNGGEISFTLEIDGKSREFQGEVSNETIKGDGWSAARGSRAALPGEKSKG